MKQTVIVFQTQSLADSILDEIAVMPVLEGGNGPVWVYHLPSASTNNIAYNKSQDGRVLIAHPWSEVDRDWLEAYMSEWISAGRVQVLDAIPADWQYGEEV
jgi:hypothetical protein